MIMNTHAISGIARDQKTLSNTQLAFTPITSLFFMWGLSYGLWDVLNKHFQDTLHVSRAQSGLVQTAFCAPLGCFAILACYGLNQPPVTTAKKNY